MYLSFEDDNIRQLCQVNNWSQNDSFTTDEIRALRALLADLRAAPNLSESPVLIETGSDKGKIILRYQKVELHAQIISNHDEPSDEQIKRLKILRVLKSDLKEIKPNNISGRIHEL